MKCHNQKCNAEFVPRRSGQLHCDTYCKVTCTQCRRRYYEADRRRIARMRRERVAQYS